MKSATLKKLGRMAVCRPLVLLMLLAILFLVFMKIIALDIWGLISLIPFFLVLWLLTRIPGAKDIFAKIWNYRMLPEAEVRVEAEPEAEEDAMNDVDAFLSGKDFEAQLSAEAEAETEAAEAELEEDVDVRHLRK